MHFFSVSNWTRKKPLFWISLKYVIFWVHVFETKLHASWYNDWLHASGTLNISYALNVKNLFSAKSITRRTVLLIAKLITINCSVTFAITAMKLLMETVSFISSLLTRIVNFNQCFLWFNLFFDIQDMTRKRLSRINEFFSTFFVLHLFTFMILTQLCFIFSCVGIKQVLVCSSLSMYLL